MAGIQIASLFASIGADTSGLDKGLKSSKGALQSFGSDIAKQVIGTLSLTAAVYKAGQTIVQSIGEWADYADGMRLAAQTAGVTTEEMSRLSQAADDFRVPMETLQRSMEMALKNGFTPSIANIAALSDELLAIRDPAERAAAASKIFGRSYAEMMPFLLAGGDAIRAATAGVADNLIVTKQGASEAKAYKDQLDALSDAWTGIKNNTGQAILPILIKIMTTVNQGQALPELTAQASEAMMSLERLGLITDTDYRNAMLRGMDDTMSLSEKIEYYTGLIDESGVRIQEFASKTDEAANSNYDFGYSAEIAAKQINSVNLSAAREEYAQTASVLIEDLAGAYDAVRSAEQGWRAGIAGKIKSEIYKEFEDGKISADNLTLALEELDQFAGTQFAYEFKIEESIPDLTKALLEDPEGFISKMSGFESAMMPLDQSVATAMEKVDELQLKLIGMERNYRATVSVYVNQSGNAVGTGSVFDKNYFGDIFDMGPAPFSTGMASGGHVSDGMPYIVGERGPELFVPNSSGEIVPNNALNGGGELLGDILTELRNQPARMKVAIKEAMALVGG